MQHYLSGWRLLQEDKSRDRSSLAPSLPLAHPPITSTAPHFSFSHIHSAPHPLQEKVSCFGAGLAKRSSSAALESFGHIPTESSVSAVSAPLGAPSDPNERVPVRSGSCSTQNTPSGLDADPVDRGRKASSRAPTAETRCHGRRPVRQRYRRRTRTGSARCPASGQPRGLVRSRAGQRLAGCSRVLRTSTTEIVSLM
eukprot:3135335-Rhodomonas_salina.1